MKQLPAAAQGGSFILADFETGFPAGWFTFAGASSVAASIETKNDADPLALPGQSGDNNLLRTDFTITDFGGFGDDFSLSGPQDWSAFDAFGFWFNGTGSGLTFQAEIFDNSNSGSAAQAERFDFNFKDDVDGDPGTRWSSAFSDPQWIYVDLGTSTLVDQALLKWEAAFGSAYEIQVSDDAAAWTPIFAETGGNGGIDALNLCGTGRFVRMFGTTRGTPYGYSLFEYEIYGDASADFTVGFNAANYSVVEGDLAMITVSICNRTGATQTLDITAVAATADGTARAGDDYTSVASRLVLPPDTSQLTFDVPTIDDSANEDAETVLLSIVDAANATISGRGESVLTIADNDASPVPALDSLLIDDFESGIPPGFFTFGGENPAITLVSEPLPGVSGPNTALRVDYNIFSFGGIVHDITPSQDWTGFEAARFGFFGTNLAPLPPGSAPRIQIEIKDGDMDLVFHFRLGDTLLTIGSPTGTLTGETFDGRFEIGSDAVYVFN